MTDEPTDGGIIEDVMPAPRTMDPAAAQDVHSLGVIQQVFDGPTTYPNGEKEAEPLLVRSVETSDDFVEYTFRLEEDVQFHDGTEVTADDFVYSWERVVASEHSANANLALDALGLVHETDDDGEYVPWSLGVEATDPYTLRMRLERPFHSVLEVLASACFVPIPEGILGDVEGYEGEMDYETFALDGPVGCGPFEFDEWGDGEDVYLSRFEKYHGTRPYVDGVHWKLIQDAQERYQYSIEKRSDRIFLTTEVYDQEKIDIEYDDLGRGRGTYGPLANGETVDYLRVPELSTFYFGFNTAVVPKPVRQAVAFAINQRYLAEVVFKNRSEPAYHVTPPIIFPGGRDAYWDHVNERYPYGVDESRTDRATERMEEAGYTAADPYELVLTVYELDSWIDIGEHIADQVADAHIDVSIETNSPRGLVEAGEQGDLEMFTLGRIGHWPAPDSLLKQLYPKNTDTSQKSPTAYVNWSGTPAAERASQASETILANPEPTEAAREARVAAYLEIEEANWDDVVYLCSFHNHSERLTYSHVHFPEYGPMSRWQQKFTSVWKES